MNLNPTTMVDTYKVGHYKMYREDIDFLYSNLTPRSDRLFKGSESYDHKMVFFGLQGFIKEVLMVNWHNNFFKHTKEFAIGRYKRRMDGIFGPGVIGTKHLEDLHDLGYLPITICALPEGSRVNMQIPVLTINNTIAGFAWLVNYLETVISASLWKSCTTATTAYEFRRTLDKYADLTGGSKDFVPLQGHDFSFRGMSGPEDSARSGSAHMLSFIGSDNIPAIEYLELFYNADCENEMIGTSVPASEHSVSSSNILYIQTVLQDTGEYRGAKVGDFGWDVLQLAEYCFMKEFISEKFTTGIVSYVADTFDFWSVVTEILPKLKDEVMARQPDFLGLNKLVIRPDSGDPVDIICGETFLVFDTLEEAINEVNDQHYKQAHDACEGSYCLGEDEYTTKVQVGDLYYNLTTKFEYDRHDKTYYYIDNYSRTAGITVADQSDPTPEEKGAIQCLWETFGGTVNDQGYKTLDEHIGLIYGDSITLERQEKILSRLMTKGFASDNVVFGMGSYAYQYVTRDTFGMAVKATACITSDREVIEIYKDPKTGGSLKKSAKGFLRVEHDGKNFVLHDQQELVDTRYSLLQPVLEDGRLVREHTLQEIRDRLLG